MKILLTGATGYLGGEVLYQLAQIPNKHQIRCVVRNDEKAKAVKAAVPAVEIVKGDLDDAEFIESEAKSADIVIHLASTRHETSTRAIIKGLSDANRTAPGYWIQISGCALFGTEQIKAGTYGEASSKVWDDVADADAIRSLITANPGRIVDNLAIAQDKVKTALVPGPIIYGKGRGAGNTRTIQGPAIADYALQHGQAFQVGKGESGWSTIHVADIARLFTSLVEAASEGKDGIWNESGIYLPENGSILWAEFARQVAKAAADLGLIASQQIKSLSAEEANLVIPHGAVVLGTNARTKSSRAQQSLGWSPREASLAEDIPLMVKAEGERRKS